MKLPRNGNRSSMLVLAMLISAGAWEPDNWSNFRCFDDPIFDATKGEAPLFGVRDPRTENMPDVAQNALILEVNRWDTHFLSSWVAAILLKEKVGYNVAPVVLSDQKGTFERMSSASKTPVHANMEIWPGDKREQMSKFGDNIRSSPLGAFGRSGLFTTTKFKHDMSAQHHFLDYWRSLQAPEVLKQLSYPSPIRDASLMGPCFQAGGAEACTTCGSDRHEFECVNGTYVSPHCPAPKLNGTSLDYNGSCGIITMMHPDYDPGVVQQMVRNLGLRFQLPFIGWGAATQHVLQREEAGLPVLFYHWQPDVFHVDNPGKFVRIMFPESTEECASRGTGTASGGIDCDFPIHALTKTHSADLEHIAGSAATTFVRSMSLSQAQLNELLAEYAHADDPAGTRHFRSACKWLKSNPHAWQAWIDSAITAPNSNSNRSHAFTCRDHGGRAFESTILPTDTSPAQMRDAVSKGGRICLCVNADMNK